MKKQLLLAGCALLFSACDGGNSSNTSEKSTFPDASPTAAQVTLENGASSFSSLISNQTVTSLGFGAGSSSASVGVNASSSPMKRSDPFEQEYTEECAGGGTMTIYTLYEETEAITALTFDQCVFEGSSTDGAVISQIEEDQITVSYPEDFTMRSEGVETSIWANSFISVLDRSSEDEETTSFTWYSSFKLLFGGEYYRVENLLMDINESETEIRQCYRKGRQYFDNASQYFDIDHTFDANCTYPFTYRSEEPYALLSGKVKLIGENNETLLLEVTGENLLTISVGPLTETIQIDISGETGNILDF